MCLQQPVFLDQLLGLLDGSGHIEDVVDVVGSGLQLQKHIATRDTEMREHQVKCTG